MGIPELRNGKISIVDSLTSLLAHDAHTHISGLHPEHPLHSHTSARHAQQHAIQTRVTLDMFIEFMESQHMEAQTHKAQYGQ
jgi:hypothetical protein